MRLHRQGKWCMHAATCSMSAYRARMQLQREQYIPGGITGGGGGGGGALCAQRGLRGCSTSSGGGGAGCATLSGSTTHFCASAYAFTFGVKIEIGAHVGRWNSGGGAQRRSCKKFTNLRMRHHRLLWRRRGAGPDQRLYHSLLCCNDSCR